MSQETLHQNEVNEEANNDNNYDNDNNYENNNNFQKRKRPPPPQSGTYRRIVVVDIPYEESEDVNRLRDTVVELCEKFGKVNNVELKKVFHKKWNVDVSWKAYVTYLYTSDAAWAVYSLMNHTFKGYPLRAYAAPLSDEDIQKRKLDKERRDRERYSGNGDMSEKKKRAKEKPKKGSLRFLAAPNTATDIITPPNSRRQTNNSGNTESPKQNRNNQNNGDYHRNNKRGMNKNTNNGGRRGKNQPHYQKVNNSNNENGKNTQTIHEEEVATPPTQKKTFSGNKYEVLVRNTEKDEIVNVFYLSQEDLDQHFPNIRTFRKESN